MKNKVTSIAMTVTEYRTKHPNCEYCRNRMHPFKRCIATNKKMSEKTTKKCPCYIPEKWKFEKGGADDE